MARRSGTHNWNNVKRDHQARRRGTINKHAGMGNGFSSATNLPRKSRGNKRFIVYMPHSKRVEIFAMPFQASGDEIEAEIARRENSRRTLKWSREVLPKDIPYVEVRGYSDPETAKAMAKGLTFSLPQDLFLVRPNKALSRTGRAGPS